MLPGLAWPGLPYWVDSVSVCLSLWRSAPRLYQLCTAPPMPCDPTKYMCIYNKLSHDLFFLVLPVVLPDIGCPVASGEPALGLSAMG